MSRAVLYCFAALVILTGSPADGAERSWQGEPLREYIEYLRSKGLRIIYSTDLVRDEYLLPVEVSGDSPETALRLAVEPFGLAITAGPAGSLLITEDPAARQARSDAEQAATPIAAPAIEPLPEIIVTSSLYNIRYEHAGSYNFLDRDQSTRMPNLGDEAVRSIARLPGTSSDGVSTRHHVRGGAQNEQLFLLDGLRLYEPYHLKDFHSVATIVDQNVISGIDFYSAGYPARYGDRMSGVVDIRLREPPEQTESEIGISFFNTWGLSRGRFGGDDRGDWLLSARRGNLDLLLDAVNPDYGSPQYADYLAHAGWQAGRHYISANALHSFDKIFIADADDTERANARYKNDILWLKAESEWNESIGSTTIMSATEIENQRAGVSERPDVISGFVDSDQRFRSLALKQDWSFAFSNDFLAVAGFELKRLEAEYAYESSMIIALPFDRIFDNEPVTVRGIETAPRGSQFAVFTELRMRAGDRLTVDAGLRWDQQTYASAGDDAQVSPRLNLLYRAGEATDLRVALGEYYQAQEINELQVSDGVLDFHPAQRAQHLVASVEHGFGSGMELRIEAYRKKYRSLMPRFENVFDPLVLIPELQVDRVRIDAESAVSDGVELSLTGTGADDLSWWASYTWSRTEDRVAGTSTRRGWDQTHALNSGFSTDWHDWSFSAAAIVRTGWPKTILQSETIQNPDGSTSLAVFAEPRNSRRHAVFGSLDARVSRNVNLPRGDLTLFLEITNLTNRQNPCCTEYSVGLDESGDPVLQASESTWLPIVPSLGVVWRF